MSLKEAFLAEFTCESPGYLPEALRERLTFVSCLMKKENRSVYQVQDNETGAKAVLKISLPGNSNNIKREYELLTKLDHPCIPRAIHYESDSEGREFFLRSYAEGDTLHSLLERDGVFGERQTLEIAGKLCEILSYLHRQTPPVIYRDISPRNIVVTPNGKLSLIDFGISREGNADKSFDTIYVGNAAFAAPEQFGFTKTDPRSDIFTLGKLMIYLTTGDTDLPHFEDNIDAPGLRKIISRCTQLSPEKRYASVEKLLKDIERILHPPTRREIAITILCAAAVLSIGFFAWIVLQRSAPVEVVAPAPIAVGDGVQDEVKIPVLIETTMQGRPFSDCVVAVDYHHWYNPAANGKAELQVFAAGSYRIRAAVGNQTAVTEAAVTKDSGPLSFSFELADLPAAAEHLTFEIPFGQRKEIHLDISQANEVILANPPNGVSIAELSDGFYLVIDAEVEMPGHYLIFMESVNEFGKTDTALSLMLTQEQPVTPIRTAQDLDQIRENLSGHYRLENDIDLSGFGHWTPIGTPENPFTGVFDGAGHTINGMNIFGVSKNIHAGLFGTIQRAVISNLILAEPNVQVSHTGNTGVSTLVGLLDRGVIENCAVLGGSIEANIGWDASAGGICGINQGAIINCFSSISIIVTDTSRSGTDSQAGGICGTNIGYIAACGNAGPVNSGSIAGGIAGFSDMGVITRCFNTGKITAPGYVGEYPPGGIVQLLGRGKTISHCWFLKGTAPVGATVWSGGVLMDIIPVEQTFFEDLPALCERLGIEYESSVLSFAGINKVTNP